MDTKLSMQSSGQISASIRPSALHNLHHEYNGPRVGKFEFDLGSMLLSHLTSGKLLSPSEIQFPLSIKWRLK